MFKCQFCKVQTKKGDKLTLIPTEFHEVSQPYPLPSTIEIKVEKRACRGCANKFEAERAEREMKEAQERLLAKFGAKAPTAPVPVGATIPRLR